MGIRTIRSAVLMAALCAAAAWASPVFAAHSDTTAEQRLSLRIWDAGDGVKGWQLFAPLTATTALTFGPGAALDINLRTGYVVADYEEPGFSGHVATWTGSRSAAPIAMRMGTVCAYLGINATADATDTISAIHQPAG